MDTFRLGEIAILVHPAGIPVAPVGVPYIPKGSEVTIISALMPRHAINHAADVDLGVIPCYEIADQEGRKWIAPPSWLRKRPPPTKSQDVGEWDLCPWKPEQPVTVSGESHG